ncbi:glypican-3 [Tachysurus ichikawai]
MVTSPEKRWKARPGGGTARRDPDRLNQGVEDEEGLESGDCDDEDECAGVSGLGPPTRRKRLRIFSGGPEGERGHCAKGHQHADSVMGGLSVPGAMR